MNVKQIATIWDQPLSASPLRTAKRRRSTERSLTTRSRHVARMPRFYL